MFASTYFVSSHFVPTYFPQLGRGRPNFGNATGGREWGNKYWERAKREEEERILELGQAWLESELASIEAQRQHDEKLLRWLDAVRRLRAALARGTEPGAEEAREAAEAVLAIHRYLDDMEGEELAELLSVTRILH